MQGCCTPAAKGRQVCVVLMNRYIYVYGNIFTPFTWTFIYVCYRKFALVVIAKIVDLLKISFFGGWVGWLGDGVRSMRRCFVISTKLDCLYFLLSNSLVDFVLQIVYILFLMLYFTYTCI